MCFFSSSFYWCDLDCWINVLADSVFQTSPVRVLKKKKKSVSSSAVGYLTRNSLLFPESAQDCAVLATFSLANFAMCLTGTCSRFSLFPGMAPECKLRRRDISESYSCTTLQPCERFPHLTTDDRCTFFIYLFIYFFGYVSYFLSNRVRKA